MTDKTVFDSKTEFEVVHPLTNEWSFWYTKPPSGQPGENWSDLVKELVTVGTVEEFWGAFNAVPKVSELPRKSDYALFRKGIRPEWEDPANAKGGKWIFQARGGPKSEMDEKWINVLLGGIGGTLDPNDQVNGIVAMVRQPNTIKIALWVTGNHTETHDVALKFKSMLGLSDDDRIEYTIHDSSRSKRGANAPTV